VGKAGVYIDGSGDAGAVVVFHHDAILDVVIKGDEDLALGVLAEGLPPVPSRAPEILGGVGRAGLIRYKSAIPGDFFCSRHSHPTRTLGEEFAGRTFAVGTRDVHKLRVGVDEALEAGVHAVARFLETDGRVVDETRIARIARSAQHVVDRPRGFGQDLLVLARIVIQSVKTHFNNE
jgi:hypothetical protein